MGAPLILYGHFYKSRINDDPAILQSLHSTKASAYRSMRRARVYEYNAQRELALLWGRRYSLDHPDEHAIRLVRSVAVTD